MNSFDPSVFQVETYRPERRPDPNNKLYIRFRPWFEKFMHHHSGHAFLLTFGLGKQDPMTIVEQWQRCAKTFGQFCQVLQKNLCFAGMLTGIEMYTKHKKRKANSKALRPHTWLFLLTTIF